MIDEDLYQQAADELNSDKRRQHIWARACALASDDHDEARFLYTNLRVEELLAERNNSSSQSAEEEPDTEATLALTPVEDEIDDDNSEIEVEDFPSDMGLESFSKDIPSSYSAPSGVAGPETKEDALELADDLLESEDTISITEPVEPDPELMHDYVPEKIFRPDADLEDTHVVDESLIEKISQISADEDNVDPSDTSAFITGDEFNTSTEFDEPVYQAAESIASLPEDGEKTDATAIEDMTSELTAALDDDLTEANMVVLDAHTSELDEMLEDAHYNPPKTEEPDTEMAWLEEDDDDEPFLDSDKPERELITKHEPVIYEEDKFTEELNRQVDELDIVESAEQTSDFSQKIANDLSSDDDFPESQTDDAALPAAAMSAAAGTALLASGSESLSTRQSNTRTVNETDSTLFERESPLDLTEGRSGTLFSVFNRNGDAQAVKSGVSWSALFLTLPFLLYRKLFGTALAYLILWIIAIGGLVFCGLAWLDAGTAVTPAIQAGTIGFALLAFIGLVYLPFRHANTWRSERLENHGYELVAVTKAKNPHLAIARARRHAAMDT